MADRASLLRRLNYSSFVDAYVNSAWLHSQAWLDIFYTAEYPSGVFRQYPGAPGDLTADAGGVRTYDPFTRAFYTDAQAAARR